MPSSAVVPARFVAQNKSYGPLRRSLGRVGAGTKRSAACCQAALRCTGRLSAWVFCALVSDTSRSRETQNASQQGWVAVYETLLKLG
jgi:hypothetical protein